MLSVVVVADQVYFIDYLNYETVIVVPGLWRVVGLYLRRGNLSFLPPANRENQHFYIHLYKEIYELPNYSFVACLPLILQHPIIGKALGLILRSPSTNFHNT